MIVYFDTVRRKRPVKAGGELIKLDWTTKTVLQTMPLYPTDPDIDDDPNPRGNSRGGKGIVRRHDHLLVGTYHTILVFDLDLKLQRTITNNLFVNIHEMALEEDNIWVSATTIDGAVLTDQAGNTLKTWWPRAEPLLQERYGLFPMELDKQADNRLKYLHANLGENDNHTHLNSIIKCGKRTYALLNRQGVLVQFEPNLNIILDDPLLRGGHSPVVTKDGQQLILCGSQRRCVLCFDLTTRRLINTIDLVAFPEIAALHAACPDQPFNKSIFVRGLELLDANRILVGIAPAAILEIDISHNQLLDWYQYSTDVGDAVHGLVHVSRQAAGS